MSTVLFAGPTIAADEALDLDPTLDVRSPAAHGDVYRAARAGAATIILVDGVFDWVRSVWHKEILWALTHDVRVIGAASMGALRAAECAAFGMEPCGVIAADYVSGRRTSDGDVAQAHATRDDGWRPLSEALVNVDATIDAALDADVIDAAQASALRQAARRQFYADRVWPSMLADAAIGPADAARFRAWLPGGYVDRKRLDARAAIVVAATTERPHVEPFELAETALWRRAAAACTSPVARIGLAALND